MSKQSNNQSRLTFHEEQSASASLESVGADAWSRSRVTERWGRASVGPLLVAVLAAGAMLACGAEPGTGDEAAQPETESAALGLAGLTGLPPGDSQHSVVVDGITHDFFVHVPSRRRLGGYPLVVSLHGGGGNAQSHETTVNMTAASEQYGFVLVTPEGYKTAARPKQTWNAGACCGVAADHDVDHVAAIEAIVSEVEQLVRIRSGQVYAMGHSNGGMMAYRLACDASETFAAIALSSGYLMDVDVDAEPDEQVFVCNPSRPVGILHFHGKADLCAPFYGGPSAGFDPSERPPVSASIQHFLAANQCSPGPDIQVQGQARCMNWDQCAGGVEVELCAIEGHGHSWPGATRYPSLVCGGELNDDVGTAEMWEFFERHAR